ncbi:MAG: hypothetical protein QXM86_03885 [Candidatus Bathyarchaeia archaeon]
MHSKNDQVIYNFEKENFKALKFNKERKFAVWTGCDNSMEKCRLDYGCVYKGEAFMRQNLRVFY